MTTTSTYTRRATNDSVMSNDIVNIAAMMPATAYGTQGILALTQIARAFRRRATPAHRGSQEPRTIGNRARTWMARHRRYRELQRSLGVELAIPYEKVDSLLEEVQKHRWIEAEKAGRDIWAEKDQSNPADSALRDWFEKHFGGWYLENARAEAA